MILTPKYEFASTDSKRKIERAEITNFEIAEEKDYIDIKYILASSIPNGNGALFTKEELEQHKDTILNTPLIIVPSWEDGLPTGHSIDDFPKLSWNARIIGTHIASEIIEENGITHLKTTARMWKIREPEIAQTLLSLHKVGDLKFSMECKYQNVEVSGNTRILKGVSFIGSAVVDSPANPFSYSLEAAQKHKGGIGMNLEQALQRIGELESQIQSYKKDFEKAQQTEKASKETIDELKKSLKAANENVDKLQAKVKEFEEAAKQAEAKELATKRLNEMSKYVEYTEEEKNEKMATFASMSDDVYKLLLETAMKNKKDVKPEVAGLSSDTKLDLQKGFLDGIENLD